MIIFCCGRKNIYTRQNREYMFPTTYKSVCTKSHVKKTAQRISPILHILIKRQKFIQTNQ